MNSSTGTCVTRPAYNAGSTLERTLCEVPRDLVSRVIEQGCRMVEISCPTRYVPDAASISFGRFLRCDLGVLAVPLAAAGRRPGRANHFRRSEVT